MKLTEIVPDPEKGRAFEQAMRPGIADADAAGRCRLDAMARWLQDIAYADLVDAASRAVGHGSCGAPGSESSGSPGLARTSC